MSTHSAHPLSQRSPDSLEHELRVQLEGAWEVLEEARVRQSALLEPLASRRWMRHLRRQPALLRQVRELEAPLGEALARAERRLEQGSRSEQQPLALLAHELRTQRTRLETLVRDRLARLGEQGSLSFVEGLERLETKLREPPAPPLFEGELVLLSISDGRWVPVLYVVSLIALLYWKADNVLGFIRSIPSGGVLRLVLAGMQFLMLTVPVVRTLWGVGRFLLTPRRLVWKPLLGKTKQLSLDSIPHDGITTEPHAFTKKTGVLRVKGGTETLTLSDVRLLERMKALLELHRRPLLFGRVLGPPTYPLALFQATRRPASSGPEHAGEPGMLVLRSGYVAFLPEEGFDFMLRALFGEWPRGCPKKLTLPLMMQQLSLLPEADFDRCVEDAVRAGGGALWPAATVTHGSAPSGQGYQFTPRHGPVLTGVPDDSLRDAFDCVMRHWPPQEG
ncbi:hypothetical protein JQX13_20110 [Archangium violaceum]|uniref:hypothetical protein n=1 Tax=Archangium violaceum TaxID=83451 RepID=UPI00193B7660|nr:hypothetical protein [Archangium violaceum]QRK12137.1 hypothetical protein JQX13_20110 [Archangium violaceum]